MSVVLVRRFEDGRQWIRLTVVGWFGVCGARVSRVVTRGPPVLDGRPVVDVLVVSLLAVRLAGVGSVGVVELFVDGVIFRWLVDSLVTLA